MMIHKSLVMIDDQLFLIAKVNKWTVMIIQGLLPILNVKDD